MEEMLTASKQSLTNQELPELPPPLGLNIIKGEAIYILSSFGLFGENSINQKAVSEIPYFRQDSWRIFWAVNKADHQGITGSYYEYFHMLSMEKFGIFKEKLSKPSIIRQNSHVSRPNWRKVEWQILERKPGTTFSEPLFLFGYTKRKVQ